MNPVTRLSLIIGCFFALASVVIAVVYFYFSPMWQAPQQTEAISLALQNPSINITQLRSIAENGQITIHASLKTLDSAIELLLTFMVFATVGFFYLAFYTGKHALTNHSSGTPNGAP